MRREHSSKLSMNEQHSSGSEGGQVVCRGSRTRRPRATCASHQRGMGCSYSPTGDARRRTNFGYFLHLNVDLLLLIKQSGRRMR